MLLVAILATICVSTPTIDDALRVPEWPTGLSDPRQAPTDGVWADAAKGELRAGLFLPEDLATAVHTRLLYLDRYPEVCQAALDAQKHFAVAEREQLKESLTEDGWWHKWVFVAGVIGGGVAGFFIEKALVH